MSLLRPTTANIKFVPDALVGMGEGMASESNRWHF